MKTVLITGCNRGLGKYLVEAFAKDGYKVIALNRSENADFNSFCQNLKETTGKDIWVEYAELENKDSIEKALDNIEKKDISIDVLINNAAYNICKPTFFMEYEDVDKSFKINYLAPFYISKRISNLMARQGNGVVLNITSVASITSEPGGAAYDASKAALNQFTKSLAQELAPFNIRVNAVACSLIETDMFNQMDAKVQKKILKRIAFKRAANPNEIYSALHFLTSDDSSYVTGQIIRVDGGFLI